LSPRHRRFFAFAGAAKVRQEYSEKIPSGNGLSRLQAYPLSLVQMATEAIAPMVLRALRVSGIF
jgi:hypothetical protein